MRYILLIAFGFLVGCANSSQPITNSDKTFSNGIWGDDYYISGMHYAVQGNTQFGIVINITKDSLECEYYKKQLAK